MMMIPHVTGVSVLKQLSYHPNAFFVFDLMAIFYNAQPNKLVTNIPNLVFYISVKLISLLYSFNTIGSRSNRAGLKEHPGPLPTEPLQEGKTGCRHPGCSRTGAPLACPHFGFIPEAVTSACSFLYGAWKPSGTISCITISG